MKEAKPRSERLFRFTRSLTATSSDTHLSQRRWCRRGHSVLNVLQIGGLWLGCALSGPIPIRFRPEPRAQEIDERTNLRRQMDALQEHGVDAAFERHIV